VAGRIDVTGDVVNSGGAAILARIRTHVRPTLDPLAFLPVPSMSGPVRSFAPMVINTPVPTILQPGVYRGGIRATGLSTVTMMLGLYVMDGGGFQVDAAATVVGVEVMVYNTSGSTAAGPISVGGLGRIALSAPLSGTYEGINFFQNRALTQPVSIT